MIATTEREIFVILQILYCKPIYFLAEFRDVQKYLKLQNSDAVPREEVL